MTNYIVNESSSNIRMVARQYLKGNWKSSVLAMFIYVLCIAAPTFIIIGLFGGFTEEALMSEDVMMPGEGLSTVYSLLVSGAFTFGITAFFLELVREQKKDIGLVFSGFGYFFKTLLLYVVMSIFIMLWTLLLIIPGIIAAIRYSQAFYILADDPSKGVMQCIRESKEMMKGNKSKYLCLQLSFIGWYVVMYLVFLIIVAVASSAMYIVNSDAAFVASIVFMVIGAIALIIGVLILLPYIQAATTVFYEMANGNLRRAPEELPPLSQSAPERAVDNNAISVNEDNDNKTGL